MKNLVTIFLIALLIYNTTAKAQISGYVKNSVGQGLEGKIVQVIKQGIRKIYNSFLSYFLCNNSQMKIAKIPIGYEIL